jgi:phosphoribosyl 1,2-cyclic phosphodiesterase/ActR/RegA family two-component response regulator
MKTVLLIDDDKVLRHALSTWLKAAGWSVYEAQDGEEGLKLAFSIKPKVVLVDLLMPKVNGFQVCRSLRARRDILPDVRIVVTTGSGYNTDRLNALEAGADDYLVKPISPEDLSQLLDGEMPPGKMQVQRSASGENAGDLSAAEMSSETIIRFWGVRGSIPTPGPTTVFYGGNTSCVEVRTLGEIIVLDAGTGIRPLGLALEKEFGNKPIRCTVLISHTHWDHIQGFPFFVPAYNQRNNVRILGFEGARQGLESTLSAQMESPYFPISMQQMPGHIEIIELKNFYFEVGPVPVQAELVNHPGICTGYRISSAAGGICYLPDIELFQRLRSQSNKNEDHLAFAQSQDEKLLQFIKGAVVLIIDSQYDAEEYASHVGWGHSCVEDAVDLALSASVKRLYLFHHDPVHTDEEVSRLVAKARAIVLERGSKLIVEAAREGEELRLAASAEGLSRI